MDSSLDGSETDVDCGGPMCGKCANGKKCVTDGVAGDCQSGVCSGTTAKTCAVPSCTDAVQNGTETDLNCGGSCPKCADGKTCGVSADCASGVCGADGKCAAPSCTDAVQNGTETDLNCGGTCPACASGKKCAVAADCSSRVCSGTTTKTCAVPSCTDKVLNGTETDVDCGGSCAPMSRCANNLMCMVAGDCQSANCTANKCLNSGCQTCWKVQYQYTNAGAGWSGENFNIVSIGTTSTALSNLKIRYWFTADGQTLVTPPSCFSFSLNCSIVNMTFGAVSPPRTKADTYLEITFTGTNTLAAGATVGPLQAAYHGPTFAAFNLANDYSANTATTTFKDAPAVTLYDQNGNLVWGTEPPACATGAACP